MSENPYKSRPWIIAKRSLKSEYLSQGLAEEEATRKALESFGEQKQLTRGLQASMFPYDKAFKAATWMLFALYAFIVLFKLLFQRIIVRMVDAANGIEWNRYAATPPDSEGYLNLEVLKRNANFIPFRNTVEYLTGADRYNMDIIIHNTLGNILIFLPLGFFLPLLFKRYGKLSKIIVDSMVISFAIETLQIGLKIGQFDIDDVILNTFGSVLGFLLFKIMKHLLALSKGSSFRKIAN
ncbi:MAG: VanZ family protein [Thermobacillus sp.]|uniref:VanZ family protein n=1 Tax=Thermobacillus sp. TaxID=2108467 RepID=UPI000E36E047|nr:VanZ family protein [Thermobacillus sp.]REK56623.1 MAG: VanZ family protein [Thermobacillus sp.]